MKTTIGLTCLLAALPGCSWLFVEEAPPQHARMRYFDCTSSRAAPIIDTVVASVYGLSAVLNAAAFAAANDDGYLRGDEGAAGVIVAIPIGIAVATGFSAAYGYETTAECDEAKTRLAERGLSAPSGLGCASDADCRGDRVCERGACVLPAPPGPPPTAPALPPADPTLPAPPPPADPTAPAPPPADPTVPAPPPADPTVPAPP